MHYRCMRLSANVEANWCFTKTKECGITKAKIMKHGLCTKASWLAFQVKIANNNLASNK